MDEVLNKISKLYKRKKIKVRAWKLNLLYISNQFAKDVLEQYARNPSKMIKVPGTVLGKETKFENVEVAEDDYLILEIKIKNKWFLKSSINEKNKKVNK